MNRQRHASGAQAIILAAGYGRRMRPLTNHLHKTLLKVGSKTVLQMILDSLLQFGINGITIVTGYREADLRTYITATYPSLHINYVYNERYEQTNNIYSMALALDSVPINGDIILIESDLIFEPAVLERLLRSRHRNVALVDHWRPGMDGTVVALNDDQHTITSIIPPHLQDASFDFSDKYKTLNIYKFSETFSNNVLKKILSYYAKAINDNCYYELILGILIYMNDVTICAEILDGEQWTEIDDPNDLDIARFSFDQSAKRPLLDDSFGGYWRYDILDFRFIRNMHFPTSAVLSELKNNLSKLLHNYGSRQAILDRKLATFLLLDSAERVTALNGLSQVFPLLKDYVAGKRVLLPDPSFGEYSRMFPHAVTYADHVGFDKGDISAKLSGCDAAVFINPNNPTGSLLATDWLYELAVANPDTLLIVDESFLAFSDEESIVSRLEDRPLGNVLVLTSLSKVLGVPGLRLGYTYSANQEFNRYLRARIPIWNMNSMAEFFLEVVLKHREALKRSISQTVEDRRKFAGQLKQIPLVRSVHESAANFILVSLDCEPVQLDQIVDELLREHRIYIKDTSEKIRVPGSHVRLAVRKPEENRHFVQCFRRAAIEVAHRANEPRTSWHAIWKDRDVPPDSVTGLERLLAADGFDTAFGGRIDGTEWSSYVNSVAERLGVTNNASVFEVGCGAGAFLYPFFQRGLKVAGLDYAANLAVLARHVMPGATVTVDEAIRLSTDERFDFVVAHSVFQYFPDLDYAAAVLRKMVRVAAKAVCILDVPDASKKNEAIQYRTATLGDLTYARRYKGLEHLYFDRSWFAQTLADEEMVVDIQDQDIPGYGNSKYRFNVYLRKKER